MKIIKDWPPNIKEIKQILPISEKVVYCYGDKIYVPDGHELEPEIIYHESIHAKQQGNNPKEWWYKYLVSPVFRLEQELEAYSRQYAWVKKLTSVKRAEIELNSIAEALSGKFYGNLLTFHEAETLIRHKANAIQKNEEKKKG